MNRFLLLHGWQNTRPREHWQHWLADRLRAQGHQVTYPQLPEPFRPRPAAWTRAIAEIVAQPGRWTVICHSLACVAWLHLAAEPMRPVERLVFVAPPSMSFLAGTPELRDFIAPREVFDRLAGTSVHRPRLVCSDEDPYCRPPAPSSYPNVFDVNLIKGGGHLDLAAGLHEWPELLRWCHHPHRTITCRLPVPSAR